MIAEFLNVFFNFGGIAVKRDCDITDDWDLNVFFAITNVVTLSMAIAFLETGDFLKIYFESSIDSGLTT